MKINKARKAIRIIILIKHKLKIRIKQKIYSCVCSQMTIFILIQVRNNFINYTNIKRKSLHASTQKHTQKVY